MPSETLRAYASDPLHALFAHELSTLAPILGGVYGVWGLHLRPDSAAPLTLPAHLLSSIVELDLEPGGRFNGSLRCDGAQLPFASECFKLVIAQHVLDRPGHADAMAEQLARLLAPEGIALVYGFNPISLWRFWLRRRRSASEQGLCFSAAAAWRNRLQHAQLDVLQTRYVGRYNPWRETNPQGESGRLSPLFGRFRPSWLLIVRKRRSALTPLRLASVRAEVKFNPALIPGAHRECA
jgi:hypothetical protein